ncbi:ABC transporter family substrate-binding protein [Pseudonocardia sp. TRM90224]|uniref:ABC transporter family substrate-binding protein n=1 Tax=Pseudonocardia sp. TRM90224 TaxID=2812678 RepID=UPI001E48552D|nr:ABC transporter family substrate-binding protein [Pseudonocardia sp. TRM90224]
MRTRPKIVAVLALAALVLTACGGGGGGAGAPGAAGVDELQRGVNDVNPVPRDQVRDGGDMRWPLDAIPDNFNINHVDGNLVETRDIVDSLLPGAFKRQADASVVVDTDYFTSIELTSKSPQVVTYTINPKASWDDGTPITWSDLQAQWQALNGKNAAYRPASTSGYENIGSVERGADDKQAVVTFASPYGEWKALYEFIYPAATNRDPEAFNKAWVNTIGVTAGPFRTENVDTTAQTVTAVRNDKWWGDKSKLDRIVYRVVERSALADALANNELDFYQIGSDVNLFTRAQSTQGATVRQAVEPFYNHITFNGGEGRILADPALRRAVTKGIDRQSIAKALIGQIVPDTTPLGNHLYLQGSADYVDNAGPVAFDAAAAGADLDKLGWVAPAPGQPRAKNGQPLKIQYVTTAGNPISERLHALISQQLTSIGVQVETVPASASDLFDQYATPGNFDLITFAYFSSPFPIDATKSIFTTGSESNFSRISSPEVDAMYKQAAAELDDAARTKLGQEIDKKLWDNIGVLPTYQVSGAYAVRATLANFGAKGYADDNYKDMGFVNQ